MTVKGLASSHQTDPILDTIEQTLNDTRALLANLTGRLEVIRQRIAENEQELERARNLTEEGQALAGQVNEVRSLKHRGSAPSHLLLHAESVKSYPCSQAWKQPGNETREIQLYKSWRGAYFIGCARKNWELMKTHKECQTSVIIIISC